MNSNIKIIERHLNNLLILIETMQKNEQREDYKTALRVIEEKLTQAKLSTDICKSVLEA